MSRYHPLGPSGAEKGEVVGGWFHVSVDDQVNIFISQGEEDLR